MPVPIVTLLGFLDVSPPDNTSVESCFVNVARAGNTGGTLEFRLPTLYGGIVVLAGTPTTGSTVGATIAGTAVTAAQTTGQQVSDVAAALAAAINANGTTNLIVKATADGANVRISALQPGAVGAYSLVATQTGGTMTAVASVPTLVLNGTFLPNAACSVSVSQ